MQRFILALAMGPMVLSLTACGLFRQSAAEEPSALAQARSIPPQFRGHWSDSLDNCDLDAGDRTQWGFVTENSVGSFEHLYSATEINVGVNTVTVTTKETGSLAMREVGPGRVRFTQSDGSTSIAVRCPQVEEN